MKSCSSLALLLLATGVVVCCIHCVSASPSEVVGPYIASPAQPISPWEKVTIVTNVTDFASGTNSVTLFYSTDVSAPRHYTSVPMTRFQGDQKIGSYLAQIPEQTNGTDVYFFTRIVDGSGNTYEMTSDERDPAHYKVMVFSSYFDILYLGIEQVDPTELTADIRVTIRAYLPFQGEPPSKILVRLQNDFADYRTVDVPRSGKYEYELQTDLKGLQLIGDASLYPFDRYVLDLNFTLFFDTTSASYFPETIYLARFSDSYVWQLRSTNTTSPAALSGSRISVHIDFARKLESAYSVVLPLILGFVALGVVPMIRSSTLSARTAVCLAILTFAVAFPFTISSFVPHRAASATLAEAGFISLLAYSVIFLITSVLANLLARPVAREGNVDLVVEGIGLLIVLLLFFLFPLVKGTSFSRTLFDLANAAHIDGLNFAWLLICALGYGLATRQIFVFVRPHMEEKIQPATQSTDVVGANGARRPDERSAWDLFICHSTEDKDEIARPLADALTAKSLKVWYDEFTLTLGDSLSRKIDEGLANSRFGVVILSPSFFKKEWPRRELDGLRAKEISYGKTILPVWHKVDRDYVLRYSPTLADKLAVSTSEGLDKVVDEILKAVSRSSTERSSKDISPLPRVSSEQDKDMFARQLQDLPAGIGVLEKITSRGYWKVLLRPQVFKQDRVPTLLDCEKHVTDCHVSLRGWNYPHYSRIESGLENVWCHTDSDDRKEFWCFYQTAQFVNYFACIEDWWQDSRWWSSETAKRHGPGEALEIWSTLFRLTEIYEFASRLAQKGVFSGDLYVSVDLHGMLERKLVALHGSLDEEYTSKIAGLDFEKRFSVQELISKAPELALEHLLWIFERFGWRDVSSETVDVLKVEQKKLLERRL